MSLGKIETKHESNGPEAVAGPGEPSSEPRTLLCPQYAATLLGVRDSIWITLTHS